MAPLLSIILTALVASVVAADGLASRGSSKYYPSRVSNSTNAPARARDDCVGDFGDSVVCNDQGCFQLICCPGLISVADKCRDPCDLAPSTCN
ncbi:hypothetical protein DFH09DRAFT_1151908 [Mycena vulgaris]|nr:hypothetical protein DFH09DRAFT_1151908 [Mycena vulgaris]